MNPPSVFISCVSPEFRQTRIEVANILTGLAYTPVVQEIFGTESGDLRQVLRDKIDACAGLIQIVGHGYGAEPPNVDADYGRVSYAQFEFLYAREKAKKTWLLFPGDACTRDTSVEGLDLPSDSAHPDPSAYQAERRALQLTYRDKRRNDGHVYYNATNNDELKLKVALLRDELAEQRRAFENWQKEVLERLTVTTEKIRAHLLESVERTHQTALAEAEKAKGWEERERLRQAAEQARAGRISRIDELAASFAEIEGTGRSTQIFDEMTRILAEEGVDQALAYVATKRPNILEKVKARAFATREKNRADLLPLLKSAQLQVDRNQHTEATCLLAEILDVEPDWSDALHQQFWFLITQGDHAFEHTTLAEAFGHFQVAETIVQRLLKAEPDAPRSQRGLSVVFDCLGKCLISRGQPGDAEGALAHYQRSNQIHERLLRDNPESVQAARDVTVSLQKLGDFLVSRGQPGDAEGALAHYQRCNEVLERILKDDPQSVQAARDVSGSLRKLGDFLASRGHPGDAEGALAHYQRSLELCERLLLDNPQSAKAARDVSMSLRDLSYFLVSRGQPGDAEKALAHNQRSLELCERLLLDNPQSAQASRDVSISLSKLGDFLADRGQPGDAEKALAHYQRCNEVLEHILLDNPRSAQASRDVSISFSNLGDFLIDRGQPGDAEKALAHYQRSLELCERLLLDNPQSAQASREVSISLSNLGDFLAGRGQPGDAEKALAHYQRSNQVLERLLRDNPQSAAAARDISVSLDRLGDFLAGRGQPGDAGKALAHYQRSLELRERLLRDNPHLAWASRDVSMSLNRLGALLAGRGQPGDAEKALVHHQRSNELSERLLRDNPQSVQAARDVSASLIKLGTFLAGRSQPGDAEKALAHFQRSNEILERILRDNPQSAQAARGVSVSCYKLGLFERQLGNESSAMAFLKRCFILLESFIREDRPMDPAMRTVHQYLKPLFTESKHPSKVGTL